MGSGTDPAGLASTLRAFDLIDDDARPTNLLVELAVDDDDEQRRAALAGIMNVSG